MDDLEFVRRCVKPDKQAWDTFLNKYSRLIYSYTYNVLKIRGADFTRVDVDGLFQEIICSLIEDNFKKLKGFKGLNGCSLASWLRLITINYTIDYLRKNKETTVSLEEELPTGKSLNEIIAADAELQSENALNSEKLASLKDCIKRLGTDDRYFLELNLNLGLSLEEIKDYFGVSRPTVDMRKSRIIERLRNCFKEKGFILTGE